MNSRDSLCSEGFTGRGSRLPHAAAWPCQSPERTFALPCGRAAFRLYVPGREQGWVRRAAAVSRGPVQTGGTLIEVLIAMALSAILLPALATAVITSREGRAQDSQRLQANLLQREAVEAVRSVRQSGWANVATNGTYYPATSGGNWTLTSGTQTVNGFTRSITISDVQRASAAGAIVASGGTVDPSTKKATISVGWSTPIATTISTDMYLQRYLSDAAWTQTTQAQFDTGTKTNTVSTNTAGGEVQLATVPTSIDWSSPTIAGAYDASGSTDANDVYVDAATNRAYLAVGSVLYIINIATPSSPALLGSFTAGGAINGVAVSGNYAYLATANTAGELTVVNVTTPSAPTSAATLDLTNTTAANCIFVSGNFAYIGRVASSTAGVNELYVVSIATPTSPSVSGSLNLPNNVNSVYVSGTVAYLATANTAGELTIVNVATPASPAQLGVYNSAGTAVANDVFAVGTTTYLVEANNTGGAEFFIVNASTPASPTLTGSYEAGANVNGVFVSGTNAFLATAVTSKQFMVLSLTTPATPTLTGSTNLSNATNDVVFSGNNAYLASTSNTQELTAMQGTTTGGGYQASGTFESSSFDAAASAAFNYLTFTLTEPASTDVRFQLAVNADNATWNYFGPDGTSGTYFSTAGAVPLGKINGRYIRYKATLTGNGSVTPVMQDVSVNYSP